jgi:2-keto-4-pentenoate hydratase/2-oxohepta-3-ene-1,7-dioic acid hydratase in catechol pathway
VAIREDGTGELLRGSPGDESTETERVISQESVGRLELLPPCAPAKVIGLGHNYRSLVGPRAHYDEPIVFLKSPTSVCAHGSRVQYPAFATKVWVEVELGVVIGKRCRSVSAADAGDSILGYTIGGDITAENIHGRDWHLARSKALDGFAPVGPWLVRGVDTSCLGLQTLINGRRYQRGNTNDRILDDRAVVGLVSSLMTLEPGDLILTGTPAGATDAIVKPGDVVTHQIDQLGELQFTIV